MDDALVDADDAGVRSGRARRRLIRRLGIVPLCVILAECGSEPAQEAALNPDIPPEGDLPGAGGIRIHYRVLGAGPDTVVAVHGGPGAGMHAILPEIEPLAEERTVVFYDQRGGGLSELPSDTTLLEAPHMVADLEAVRRFFGLERMSLIAHSFGSILVARYAEEHPERIERIVLFGAVGPSREEAGALARAAARPPDPGRLARLQAVMASLLSGETIDPVADCEEYEAIGREMALARGESGAWKGTNCAMPPEAVRYYFRYTAQIGPRSFGNWDFTESLRELDAPLLVIHGDNDLAAVALQRQWAAAVPNGRLLLVSDAGKAVSADRPDVFFPAVESFLGGEWPAGAEPVSAE